MYMFQVYPIGEGRSYSTDVSSFSSCAAYLRIQHTTHSSCSMLHTRVYNILHTTDVATYVKAWVSHVCQNVLLY
jgi:hypothetical protein